MEREIMNGNHGNIIKIMKFTETVEFCEVSGYDRINTNTYLEIITYRKKTHHRWLG